MHKKIINIILSIILVLFSFYYTNNIINSLKEKDPIMIEIKKYNELYPDTKIESTLNNNNIIPGIKGTKINVEKSYSNMKKIGKFDKTLLVFEETKPNNDLQNNYIVSLNKNKNIVSLLFKFQDTSYIEEIISILKQNNVNATFFLSSLDINNWVDLVKLITNNGNDIELLSNNYSVYEVNKINSIIKLISNDKLKYCLNELKNDKLLNSCKSSKLYTIVPTINQKNNLYNSLKNNLENGSIILLNNTKPILNELSSSIKYIKQKGYKIELLKNILED